MFTENFFSLFLFSTLPQLYNRGNLNSYWPLTLCNKTTLNFCSKLSSFMTVIYDWSHYHQKDFEIYRLQFTSYSFYFPLFFFHKKKKQNQRKSRILIGNLGQLKIPNWPSKTKSMVLEFICVGLQFNLNPCID